MLYMLNVNFLLRVFVVTTIAISTLIYYFVQFVLLVDYEAYKVISISSIVSAVLGVALVTPGIYRPIWRICRKCRLTKLQDLNGTWSGTISPSGGDSIDVKATIRQSLFSTEIDMHGATIKSITLTASPIVESGQYRIYYVYRAEPKKPDWPPYSGTTKFTLRVLSHENKDVLALSGQYFTDRKRRGTVELKQIGNDPSVDVSYY